MSHTKGNSRSVFGIHSKCSNALGLMFMLSIYSNAHVLCERTNFLFINLCYSLIVNKINEHLFKEKDCSVLQVKGLWTNFTADTIFQQLTHCDPMLMAGLEPARQLISTGF
jgi:hypothetical protein